ncbi:hypothetical protein BGZ74_000698 [Mortierella antarctica]|nr:hypothetical protein BGZ74_000698 [Mortierella antarctica]
MSHGTTLHFTRRRSKRLASTKAGTSHSHKGAMKTRTTLSGPRKATTPQVILIPDSDEESGGDDRVFQERNRGTPSPSSQGLLKRRFSCELVEESDDDLDDRRNRDASTVSWSDSYADSGSERDSEEDEVEESFQEHSAFRKSVSVVLSQSHQPQDGGGHAITLDAIRPGDQIRVHNAAMLVQELQSEKSKSRGQDASQDSGTDEIVVSCLGVSGKTTFTVSRPDPVHTAQKPETATPKPSTNGSHTTTSDSLEQATKKRRITTSRTIPEFADSGFSLQQQMEQLQQENARIRERNPLELLVRKRPPLRDPNTQPKKGTSSLGRSPETTTSRPPPCFATLWSANIPGATHNDSSKGEEEMTIHDSVCRKTRLQSVMVRAVCAECGNDYKELRCTFGCRSMTWSIFVKLRCEISDGTANAILEVEGVDDNDNRQGDGSSAFQSKEEIMWTLLGLSRKSCRDEHAYKGQGAPLEEVKNRVLQILARRGEFAYTFDSETAAGALAKQPSTNKKQGSSKATGLGQTTSSAGSGSVSSIGHDHTARAKAEEKLWLDVCSGVAGIKDANQHFILHATLDKKSQSYHKQSLQTTRIPIGRQFFQTLTPPPLILRPTCVQRVTPQRLCSLLTNPERQ